jgi:hypothetical protein
MPNKVFVDGREVFNARVSIATDANNAPVITPPVDTKPPARPVKPPVRKVKPSTKTKTTVRDLGGLKQTLTGRQMTVDRGETYAFKFFIPKKGTVPVAYFSFEPRENRQYLFSAWFSEEPDGKPVGGRYGQLSGLYRRNQPFGLAASVKSRGAERRGAPIDAGKYYYLNVKHNGPKMQLRWELGGAFK